MVFNNHMSVLVNESPMTEFKVSRGLRQGDLLSPFYFRDCCGGDGCFGEKGHCRRSV